MDRFVPFPSIGKLSDALKELPYAFGDNEVPRQLMFRGTVKLHGTHADLVWHGGGDGGGIVVQSRNRVLTVESDNHECARFFEARRDRLMPLIQRARAAFGGGDDGDGGDSPVVIAGEFCGMGVQSKVALCRLPRMFVVVAVKVGRAGAWRLAGDPGFADVCDEAHGIYSIARAPVYELAVDPLDPAPAIARAEELTRAVDAECPFAKGLGAVGAGEGIVWACAQSASSRLWFKTKGAAHVTPLRPPRPQTDGASDALVGQLVTVQRLAQGVDYLREMGHPLEMRSVRVFAQWVVGDVFKEEGDAIAASGLKEADVRKAISRVAGGWFKGNAVSV